ncbi:MAG: nucleotidyltransferase substrate binding protein [bacterium]
MTEEVVILGNINIAPLIKAYNTFKKGLLEVNTELERDGAIQRFEFTYELSWKTMKRILTFKGIDANSPRDVFRESAKQKLIVDPKVWFDFLSKRNLTVHTYNQDCADEIFASLSLFEKEVEQFIKTIKNL